MNICIMLLVASIGLHVNICIMLLVAFDRPLCKYLYNAACSFDSLYVHICIMLLVAFDRTLM